MDPDNSVARQPAAPVTSPMHVNGVPVVATTVRADFDLKMVELRVEVGKGVVATFRLPIEGALEPALRIIAMMRQAEAPVDRPRPQEKALITTVECL